MLLFIRHAPTIWNAGERGEERHRSWIDDIPLAPDAEQAIDAIVTLVASLPIQMICTAPEQRCQVVAQALVNASGVPAFISSNLHSWHLGNLMGLPVSQTVKQMTHYMLEAPDEPVPGGESFTAFKDRFLLFLKPLWTRPELIVIIAHGRNAMVANAWAQAGAKGDRLQASDLTVHADLLHPAQAGVLAPRVPWTDLTVAASRR